ncbi:MAG: AtpZ/AtpI family protein [Alphaproteobacteria bacterium]
MSEDQEPPKSGRFEDRLRAAQARSAGPHTERPGRGVPQGRSLGLAFRIGVELVAALIVGIGIGWLLDSWLGTGPWLFILFFMLGAVAGVMNVWRTVERIGRSSDGDGT